MTLPPPSDDEEITVIRERLAALDAERTALEGRLAGLLTLRRERPIPEASPSSSAETITGTASPAAKIALFRSLFRGREDVFPKRWSNPKSGKSGYSPACANEWVPRLCGKPKVRCGDCPNRRIFQL